MGLNATRKIISEPFVIPPWTPPEWLEVVTGLEAPGSKASLCSLPVISTAENPLPMSKPLDAGNERTALAKSASIRSKTGTPASRHFFSHQLLRQSSPLMRCDRDIELFLPLCHLY